MPLPFALPFLPLSFACLAFSLALASPPSPAESLSESLTEVLSALLSVPLLESSALALSTLVPAVLSSVAPVAESDVSSVPLVVPALLALEVPTLSLVSSSSSGSSSSSSTPPASPRVATGLRRASGTNVEG